MTTLSGDLKRRGEVSSLATWGRRLFPLAGFVMDDINMLKVRSCLIDGEVVCCDERGLAGFDLLRRRMPSLRL
jgi:ATP-dependent DNA ligase